MYPDADVQSRSLVKLNQTENVRLNPLEGETELGAIAGEVISVTVSDPSVATAEVKDGRLHATALKGEVAEQLNVCYGDGSIFFTEGNPEGAGRNCIRMNFSGLPEKVIDENIRRLGKFFCEKAGE